MSEEHKTLQGYEAFVTKLASKKTMSSSDNIMNTAGLGLAGEAGEVADICKKVVYHEMPFTEEVRQKLLKELGDVMWYLTLAAVHVCQSSLQEVLNMNVDKLSDRYKSLIFSTEEFMEKERSKEQ